jgi:hypothetical protein
MPTAFLYPNVGALWLAGIVQTAMAGSTVDLFQAGQGIILGPTTALADLTDVTVLANFTGYAQQTVAAWLGPFLDSGGGAAIDSGEVYFATGAPYTVENNIQGWFVTDVGGTVLICAGDFAAIKGMAGAGAAIMFIIHLAFGA